MKDSNKIYYLDRNTDSKRNIPFDTEFWILHVKGVGTSICQKIGSYESNKWVVKDTQQIVRPYGISPLVKWTPEIGPKEQGKD